MSRKLRPDSSENSSIPRKTSLSGFRITEDLLRKILTRHAIKPAFLDLLFGLRAQEELSEKGYGLWSSNTLGSLGRSPSILLLVKSLIAGNIFLEICYQLRYVEYNDHAQGGPWSERQIGVYHSFSSAPNTKGVMILLHAQLTSKAQGRLEDAFSEGRYNQNSLTSPLRLHLLILSSYIDNWRWYMNELGSTCLRLVRIFLASCSKSKAEKMDRRTKVSLQR